MYGLLLAVVISTSSFSLLGLEALFSIVRISQPIAEAAWTSLQCWTRTFIASPFAIPRLELGERALLCFVRPELIFMTAGVGTCPKAVSVPTLFDCTIKWRCRISPNWFFEFRALASYVFPWQLPIFYTGLTSTPEACSLQILTTL